MSIAIKSAVADDIIHLEQQVNDRFGTDPAPALPSELLPENGHWHRMAWAELPTDEVKVVCDDPYDLPGWRAMFEGTPGTMRFPIHPLVEPRYRDRRLVYNGRFTISASYRTVFFEGDSGSAPAPGIPDDHIMMIKLHLDEPLPGIAGDRRLTPDKVSKCTQLSAELPGLLSASRFRHRLSVLRERVGIMHGDRGAIVRFVPRRLGFPLFALYSRDGSRPRQAPLLIREFENRGLGAQQVSQCFGAIIAEPLLRAVFAAFDLGFSLELHAQNAMGVSSPQRLIDSVLFRDLESVQFFPELCASRGHASVRLDLRNNEFVPRPANPRRWFNRNVDHDVGRILHGALAMLERHRFLSRRQSVAAARSCKCTHRRLVDEFGLRQLDRSGRWAPATRAPYGKSWSKGGYYRTRFR